jgi:hypothetical protein
MTEDSKTNLIATTSWRFRIGLFLFVFAWVCPLFIPMVTQSDLSSETKTLLSGFLLLGLPEIISFISIAVLGRPGFDLLKSKIFDFLKRAAPTAKVSRKRHRFGVFLILLHVLFAYSTYYAPDRIPGYAEYRVVMNLIADFLFIVTLFVLGGDFWEKLRGLFLYDVKKDTARQ